MAKIIPINGQAYIRMDKIGSGGMCDVYLGRPIRGQEYVAIRELKEHGDEDENIENRRVFENGVNAHRLLERSGSRFFPRLFSYSHRAAAMEYVKGIPLSRFETLPEEVVMSIAYEMTRCLDAFHKSGNGTGVNPVHRDIKPDNILARSDTEEALALIDFDLAYVTRKDPAKNRWTRAFASPEQLAGKRVTPTSDLYSLGSTLYRLLTGEIPKHYIYDDFENVYGGRPRVVVIPQTGSVNPQSPIGQVFSACWRMNGRSYENAEHMKDDVKSKLRRYGLGPKKTRQIIAKIVKN